MMGKRMLVGEDASQLVSNFLGEANEDILLEIFVRLPNYRSAVLSSFVSHHWRRLISQPQFVPRFISHHHQHQDRYPQPYTIIFRKADKHKFLGPQYFQPICKLFSEESVFLHGTSRSLTSNYLDFLPSPMVIRASCNDLLLVSPDSSSTAADLYICNPITKQICQLPANRKPSGDKRIIGHALVCIPGDSNRRLGVSRNQFQVVGIHCPWHGSDDYPPFIDGQLSHLRMEIFSSELGKWKRKSFHYPRPERIYLNYSLDVVTCNGGVYWLEHEPDVDRVIALDLLNSQFGVIDFPDDFWWFRNSQQDSHVRERIGAVGGELRLLQVVLLAGTESTVTLKVWKLNYDDTSWVLVHDKRKAKRPGNYEEPLVALFVHPTNSDVVFLVWGKNICQYNLISEDPYEMIDELQESLSLNHWCSYFNDRLMSFPMVHPTWPTPLPCGQWRKQRKNSGLKFLQPAG